MDTGPAADRDRPGDQATLLRLDELAAGRCGQIVQTRCDAAAANRLAGMGMCPGRTVQLVQAGDPMIVRALGTRIGISHRLGCLILVRPCSAPECEPAPPAAGAD